MIIVNNQWGNRQKLSTPIPYIIPDNEWENMKSPGYCYYNHDEKLGDLHGPLYNWYCTPKLAPEGWRVPCLDDWWDLKGHTLRISPEPKYSGGHMKEVGTKNWKAPNMGATNLTGFNAIPSGGRGVTISTGKTDFTDLYKAAVWWYAHPGNEIASPVAFVEYNHTNLQLEYGLRKNSGKSIRLVKD
jgi:uncharacterized protein (TIGR02145 family)